MGLREELTDVYGGDLLFADGFDSAIVGVAVGFDSSRVVYNTEKMAKTLVEQDMSYEEAWEYLEFNTFGAWVGENTPIYFYAKEVSCEVDGLETTEEEEYQKWRLQYPEMVRWIEANEDMVRWMTEETKQTMQPRSDCG